jgi:plasmid replication initiation protein
MTKLKGGNEVSLNAKDFAETFGISEKHAYNMIKDACNNLFEREIQFNDGRRKGRARWVQEAHYYEGEGWASLKFTDIVRANIKGLETQYTKYSLEQAGNLKSVYSWRFLERFIQYGDAKKKYRGWWEISVIDLCEFLELSEFYLKWPILNQKIIKPSIKELDEKDGWEVEIKPIKTGRKTTHVRFNFKQNPQGRLEF